MVHVIHEYLSHLFGKCRLVYKGIDFEIMFETAEVHIRRTYAGYGIVGHQ